MGRAEVTDRAELSAGSAFDLHDLGRTCEGGRSGCMSGFTREPLPAANAQYQNGPRWIWTNWYCWSPFVGGIPDFQLAPRLAYLQHASSKLLRSLQTLPS